MGVPPGTVLRLCLCVLPQDTAPACGLDALLWFPSLFDCLHSLFPLFVNEFLWTVSSEETVMIPRDFQTKFLGRSLHDMPDIDVGVPPV